MYANDVLKLHVLSKHVRHKTEDEISKKQTKRLTDEIISIE